MRPQLKLTGVSLDCADPQALSTFYEQATGLPPHPESEPDFAAVAREDGLFIGFQRVENYQPPQWPGQITPQQSHMDFTVDDLDQAEALLLELGATKPEHQPGGEAWRVFVDPAGHPFCLCVDS